MSEKITADLAWKIICEFNLSVRHFNELQSKYRTLASTWLLAAFVAMGFLLEKNIDTELPVEVLILAIAIAASTGILLLWIIDGLAYQGLLDSYLSGIKTVEKQHEELPRISEDLFKSQPFGNITSRLKKFYLGMIFTPLLFGGLIFLYKIYDTASVLEIFISVLIIVIIGAVISLPIMLPSKKKESTDK